MLAVNIPNVQYEDQSSYPGFAAMGNVLQLSDKSQYQFYPRYHVWFASEPNFYQVPKWTCA